MAEGSLISIKLNYYAKLIERLENLENFSMPDRNSNNKKTKVSLNLSAILYLIQLFNKFPELLAIYEEIKHLDEDFVDFQEIVSSKLPDYLIHDIVSTINIGAQNILYGEVSSDDDLSDSSLEV